MHIARLLVRRRHLLIVLVNLLLEVHNAGLFLSLAYTGLLNLLLHLSKLAALFVADPVLNLDVLPLLANLVVLRAILVSLLLDLLLEALLLLLRHLDLLLLAVDDLLQLGLLSLTLADLLIQRCHTVLGTLVVLLNANRLLLHRLMLFILRSDLLGVLLELLLLLDHAFFLLGDVIDILLHDFFLLLHLLAKGVDLVLPLLDLRNERVPLRLLFLGKVGRLLLLLRFQDIDFLVQLAISVVHLTGLFFDLLKALLQGLQLLLVVLLLLVGLLEFEAFVAEVLL